MASGVIYYLSMGNFNTTLRIKMIWRSTGIGSLIIFGAWTLVDLLLLFLGFQIKIFGNWWQFPT
jgi:hypothetical protein